MRCRGYYSPGIRQGAGRRFGLESLFAMRDDGIVSPKSEVMVKTEVLGLLRPPLFE